MSSLDDLIESNANLSIISRAFSAALITVLQEAEGVCVELQGDDDIIQVYVYRVGEAIAMQQVGPGDEFEDGDMLWMHDTQEEANEGNRLENEKERKLLH